MFNRSLLAFACLAGGGFPVCAQTPGDRADVHVSQSWLSDGLGIWREASATFSSALGAGYRTAVQAEVHERFGINEQFVEIRVTPALSTGVFQLGVGGAGKGIFKPKLALRADYETSIGDPEQGLTLLVTGGAAWFDANEAATIKLGFEKRLNRKGWTGRAQLVATTDRAGETPLGYVVTLRGPLAPGIFLSCGYADVAEPEQLRVVEAEGWFAGLVLEVDDNWQMRFDGLSEDRGSFHRDEFGIGLARRF